MFGLQFKDNINFPIVVRIRLDVDVIEDIVHPLQTAFDLKGKALGITLPIKCENGVGSCMYPDWCVACSTCSCPALGIKQIMEIPMNLTATIPIGSKAKVKADITFRSATGQTGCVRITDVDLRK
ncbi:unnamed protein product [Rotaria sordida]|uniref:MD-2-related lipid-recognition domain-containing protein n=1 Tax=Rotaria sordida TaxID=392033 RepID=A0A814YCV1_9BILA|nr:unnamed protein product [Rotaria sordida]CAF1227758.1 unnamed protein product [Rotaria sordida]